jgi:hypothetical protein
MKKNAVFDTMVSDYNLGNYIIMESVFKHIKEIFQNDVNLNYPVWT